MKTATLLLLTSITTLPGCADMAAIVDPSNKITEDTARFDDSRQLYMEPGWVYENNSTFSGAPVKLGLIWNSANDNHIAIIARVDDIENIRASEGLWIKIDGKVSKLSATDTFTDIETTGSGAIVNHSQRYFPTTKAMLNNMVNSKEVKIRLHTGSGYIDADFTIDKTGAAIRGYKKFLMRLP